MGFLGALDMSRSNILHAVFRFVQMIFALAVCGLYGSDLHNAAKHHVPSDSKWVRPAFLPFTLSLPSIRARWEFSRC